VGIVEYMGNRGNGDPGTARNVLDVALHMEKFPHGSYKNVYI
jgi:hypothetical protein